MPAAVAEGGPGTLGKVAVIVDQDLVGGCEETSSEASKPKS